MARKSATKTREINGLRLVQAGLEREAVPILFKEDFIAAQPFANADNTRRQVFDSNQIGDHQDYFEVTPGVDR